MRFDAYLRCSECHAGLPLGVLVASALPEIMAHDAARTFKARHLRLHGNRIDSSVAALTVSLHFVEAPERTPASV